MKTTELPLFPLKTVLFPNGLLPLRVFEPRYIDMVSRCMKDESGFGVVLIQEGREVGSASTYNLGTVARIVDWFQRSDGLLGLHVVGGQRFRIRSATIVGGGLTVGQVTLLTEESGQQVPSRYRYMVQMLDSLVVNLPGETLFQDPQIDDADWVVARLADILPVSLEDRQECLELNNALDRLKYLEPYFSALRDRSGAK